VVLRCPRICSRSTVSETCGLTLKTEEESAENRTEVPHPSVQTTDGRIGHPWLQYRAGDSCLRHPPVRGARGLVRSATLFRSIRRREEFPRRKCEVEEKAPHANPACGPPRFIPSLVAPATRPSRSSGPRKDDPAEVSN